MIKYIYKNISKTFKIFQKSLFKIHPIEYLVSIVAKPIFTKSLFDVSLLKITEMFSIRIWKAFTNNLIIK